MDINLRSINKSFWRSRNLFSKRGGAPTLLARPWGLPSLKTSSQILIFYASFFRVLVKKFLVAESLLIIVILCLPVNVIGNDTFSLNGYYKLFFTGFKMPGEDAPVGSVNNRLRLKLTLKPAEWLSIDAAYDVSPRIQDPMLFSESLFYSEIDPLSYRVDDFHSRLYPAEGKPVSSFGVFHNFDRFFVTIKTGVMDIFIGRSGP